MNKKHRIFGTTLFLLSIGIFSCGSLPPHTVSESSLGNAQRVQVDSNDAQLSRTDCEKLAKKYKSKAGKGGQVVVQKPNLAPPWNGEHLAFCLDNQDGSGIVFQDFNFE